MASRTAAAGNNDQVAIFWDYENCSPPSNMSGYELVSRIRDLAHHYGGVKLFKAYTQFFEQVSPRSLALRSELQSSGVSLTDCPHNGRKNVADQMIIADILAFAMDNPYPRTTTIMLISGDRDFAYTLSILRLRMYQVIVVAPPLPGAHISLKTQASYFIDWSTIIDSQRKDSNVTFASSRTFQRPTEFPASFPPYRPKPYNPYLNNSPDRRAQQAHQSETRPQPPPSNTGSETDSAASVSKTSNLFGSFKSQHNDTTIAATSMECPVPTFSPAKHQYHKALLDDSPSLDSVPLDPFSLITIDMDSRQTILSESEHQLSPVLTRSASSFVAPNSNAENKAAGQGSAKSLFRKGTPKSLAPPYIPEEFQRLVHLLEEYRLQDDPRPLRSVVALELVAQDSEVYRKAGFPKFGPYAARAEELGLVFLSGTGGGARITLHYNLYNKVNV
ncbi:NYN domain-containing protein [Rhodocollybia butyracea]|uniref:NYN domain-containing protein n=1 Tax=Rhodocollybia butyracea TaxID=206335 RepID=A0A9P5U4L0_9AGAR|nr:NYN domain-containing protein [Rhodocollybia butyracea]